MNELFESIASSASDDGRRFSVGFYDPDSGRITTSLIGSVQQIQDYQMLCKKPLVIVPEVGARIHGAYRVLDGEVVPRPEMGAYMESNVLHNVSAQAEITIENQVYVAEGGPIELDLVPGMTYRIAIMLWPYQDQEIEYAAH